MDIDRNIVSMSGKIYLLEENGTLRSLDKKPYDSEDLLQTLLVRYPDLLAGDQINEAAPRRWLLVSREVGVPDEEDGADRWSLDHLFLDQDAVPTLVEVKRSSNTQIRRKVVGQMLDYAANAVVYWPAERIRTRFESSCKEDGGEPDQKITELIEADPEDEGAVERFWEQVKTNLRAGKIRLVFVADDVPAELRRIVEFLNVQMDPAEVLAVEIRQYAGEGLKTLVPKVMGLTAKTPPGPPPEQWNEERFFMELKKKCGIDEVRIARELLKWAEERSLWVSWGKGKHDGSFAPKLRHKGSYYWTFDVWTYGKFGVPFKWMPKKKPFDDEAKLLDLMNRLNQISGIDLREEDMDRLPSHSLSVLKEDAALEQLLKTLDWVIDEIRST